MLLQSLKARICQKISPFQVHVFFQGPEEGGRGALPPMINDHTTRLKQYTTKCTCQFSKWEGMGFHNFDKYFFVWLSNSIPGKPPPRWSIHFHQCQKPFKIISRIFGEKILRPYLNICSSFCSFVPSLMTRIIIMNSWNFNWFDVPKWRRHNRGELIFGEMSILAFVPGGLFVCTMYVQYHPK